jgi:hypothetical protein
MPLWASWVHECHERGGQKVTEDAFWLGELVDGQAVDERGDQDDQLLGRGDRLEVVRRGALGQGASQCLLELLPLGGEAGAEPRVARGVGHELEQQQPPFAPAVERADDVVQLVQEGLPWLSAARAGQGAAQIGEQLCSPLVQEAEEEVFLAGEVVVDRSV